MWARLLLEALYSFPSRPEGTFISSGISYLILLSFSPSLPLPHPSFSHLHYLFDFRKLIKCLANGEVHQAWVCVRDGFEAHQPIPLLTPSDGSGGSERNGSTSGGNGGSGGSGNNNTHARSTTTSSSEQYVTLLLLSIHPRFLVSPLQSNVAPTLSLPSSPLYPLPSPLLSPLLSSPLLSSPLPISPSLPSFIFFFFLIPC